MKLVNLLIDLWYGSAKVISRGIAIKLAGVLACLALSASAQVSRDLGEELDLCSYTLKHADEFEDLSVAARKLDGVRWTAHTPWNGDFGDAEFVDPGPAGPFSIVDGKLHITATKGGNGKWRSGLLAAADASGAGWGVQYGYFEARMKLPPGPGVWPAFWLMPLRPVGGPLPSVEIDVIEYYGHRDDKYSLGWHAWYKGANEHLTHNGGDRVMVPPRSLIEGFHDYGVLIEPEWTTYYLDRKPVYRMVTPPELTSSMYPLVNLALGSGWPIDKTPNPSVLEVDHVRIYELAKDGNGPAC